MLAAFLSWLRESIRSAIVGAVRDAAADLSGGEVVLTVTVAPALPNGEAPRLPAKGRAKA